MKRTLMIAAIMAAIMMPADVAMARSAPTSVPMIKLLLASHIGWKVDKTTGGNVCTVTSEDECRPGGRTGKLSSGPGGFRYPSSVAVAPATGNVYVADGGNARVQELTSTGTFVSMFGWGVNATKDKQVAATRAEKNVCTAASGNECTAGSEGTRAGQFTYPTSITIDPVTGDIYVAEFEQLGYVRVDKYTAGGNFVWMIGSDVNETTKGDICTEREIEKSVVKCKAGVESKRGVVQPGAFKISERDGDELAAGGPEDLLYVGDEGRVQEFEADGKWKREIAMVSLTPTGVVGIAVDKTGDLYVVDFAYELSFVANVIHKFDQDGEQIAEFVIGARPNATVTLHGLAVDSSGQLAVIGGEEGLIETEEKGLYIETYTLLGALYDDDTGRRISEFIVPIGNDGLAFNDDDELYVAATDGPEVLKYIPTPVASLVTSPLICKNGDEDETSATFDCVSNGS